MKLTSVYTIPLFSLVFLTSCGPAESPHQPTVTLQVTSTTTHTPSVTPSPTSTSTSTYTPAPEPICLSPSSAPEAITIQLYGNFNTMGVIVSIGENDPDQDAIASLAYRSGSGPFQQGFPLSRVGATEFVGSLFWLESGTMYDVQITFQDPDDQIHCTSVSASSATRDKIDTPDPVTTYVVSHDGGGSTCTMEAPCALRTGLNQAMPGDAVILRGGIYYQGDITLPRSGTSDAPIVIQGAPGELAILDGADPDPNTWTPREHGVFETTSNVTEPSLVAADGQRLYRYLSYEDLESQTRDLPGFFAQGYRLYVHLEDDADPNEHEMVISRRMYAFWVGRDYIHIKDLTFRHYEVRFYRSGLYVRDGSNNLVQGCTFALNGYGIILQGAAHQNVIEENEFYDTIYDWSWDAVKANHDRTGQGLETGGIRINDPHRSRPFVMPRGTIIRRNTFHDYFDGLGVCTFETAAIPTNETDVYENFFYRMGDDGMEADGNCSNVRIWGNTFKNVLVGVSLAPARIGPTYVIRNLIYNIGRSDGCPFGHTGPCNGTALKFQYNEPGSGPMFIIHNTMDSGSKHITAYIDENVEGPLLLSRNNDWGSPLSGGIDIEIDDPIDFDFDNITSRPGSVLVRWMGMNLDTLEAFTAVSGQEVHGLSVDPMFIDTSVGNYGLHPSSPLIDMGELIPGINHDYVGLGPDIGAYEFNPN
jgi:parallel beta-helix repeat protein